MAHPETSYYIALHRIYVNKICNVYIHLNVKISPYGFRKCSVSSLRSVLCHNTTFSHRDIIRHDLKGDFTLRKKITTQRTYALCPAANFLIRVNFLPCVFLLQEAVSQFSFK